MPVTYTITAADVSSVDPASALTAGVVFNWDDSTITTPASIVGIDGQWVVDHARFAEATDIGMTRPQITEGSGKVQIGIDPISLLPELTGVFAILLNDWEVVTQRASGQEFTVVDVYKKDASLPYDNTVDADVIYRQTVNPTISNVNTGSVLTPTQATQLSEVHRFRGLDAANPITGDDSNATVKTETDGTVTITYTISGDTITKQRSG